MKRTPPGFAPWVESQESQLLRARLKGLGNLARIVFLDRNAHGLNKPGMPRRERLAIKKKMRPHLWQAIHWTRKSRDALLAGNVEMHELLRQYGGLSLAEDATQLAAVGDRHSQFYADFMQRALPDLKGGRQMQGLAAINTEIGNIRAAWQWAIGHGQAGAVYRSRALAHR